MSGGVACGDRIPLFAYEEKEKGIVHFSFFCESCSVSKKISYQLEKIFSGKKVNDILSEIYAFQNRLSLSCGLKISNRADACQTAPVLLLVKLLNKIKNFQEEIFECNLLVMPA